MAICFCLVGSLRAELSEDEDVFVVSQQAIFNEVYARTFGGYHFGRKIHKTWHKDPREEGFSVRRPRIFSEYLSRIVTYAGVAGVSLLLASGVEDDEVTRFIFGMLSAGFSIAAVARTWYALGSDNLISCFPTGVVLTHKKLFHWTEISLIECIVFDEAVETAHPFPGYTLSGTSKKPDVRFIFKFHNGLSINWDNCPKELALPLHAFMVEMLKETMLFNKGILGYE